MLNEYFPILLFIGVGIAMGMLPVILGAILAPHRPDLEKQSTYECGFDPFGDTRKRFDVRFYLVSILFIVFDLEVAFLVPWAVVVQQLSWVAFCAMLFFLMLLLVGFVYEWKKGALEWE